MARGGPRPGAGRPRGAKSPQVDVIGGAAAEGISPLDYMLGVMRDTEADPARRDRMAQAAAPYVHAKAGESTKKEDREAASRTAERGTSWEALLPN
jgi:hypothetical protein